MPFFKKFFLKKDRAKGEGGGGVRNVTDFKKEEKQRRKIERKNVGDWWNFGVFENVRGEGGRERGVINAWWGCGGGWRGS